MFLFVSQAEEGIREWSVTGVQTCALPISRAGRFDFVDISKKSNRPARVSFGGRPGFASEAGAPPKLLNVLFQNVEAGAAVRSEERRVGKDRRTRAVSGLAAEQKQVSGGTG